MKAIVLILLAALAFACTAPTPGDSRAPAEVVPAAAPPPTAVDPGD